MFLNNSACMLQDLARTFPANDYMSTEEGQAALRRVLLAFSVHQPQVIARTALACPCICTGAISSGYHAPLKMHLRS